MSVPVEKVVEPEILEEFQPIEMQEIQFNQYVGDNSYTGKKHGTLYWEINGKEYPNPIRAWVNDIVKGKAPIICFHGQRQSGKSLLAMWVFHQLHNEIGVLAGEWHPDKHLHYSVSSFMGRTLSFIREGQLTDEAGKLLPSSEWWSDYNQANDDALETLGCLKHVNGYISTEHSDLDNGIKTRDKYKVTPHPGKHDPKPGEDAGTYVFQVKHYKYDKQSEKKKLRPGYPKNVGNLEADPEEVPEEIKESYREKEFKFKYEGGKQNQATAEKVEKEEKENW